MKRWGDPTEILELIELLPDYSIVIELGSFRGGSAAIWASSHKVQCLFCVDAWTLLPENIAKGRDMAAAEKGFDDTMQKYVGRFIKLKMNIDDAADTFNVHCADLVYIDGDHSYEGITKDIINYYPLVKPGGILAGHDYVDEKRCKVKQRVDEVFKDKVTLINQTWYVRKEEI